MCEEGLGNLRCNTLEVVPSVHLPTESTKSLGVRARVLTRANVPLYAFASLVLVITTLPIDLQRQSFPLAGWTSPLECLTQLCPKRAATTVVWAVGALTLELPTVLCVRLLAILPL